MILHDEVQYIWLPLLRKCADIWQSFMDDICIAIIEKLRQESLENFGNCSTIEDEYLQTLGTIEELTH